MKSTATILILLALSSAAMADTTEVDGTYFHPAASMYIHGDSTTASNLVAQGLSIYPNDPKLKRLKALIEQQQKQNQQQNKQDQQNQDQQQNQENQQDQEQDQQDQQPQDEQNKEQQDTRNEQDRNPQNEQEQPEQQQAGQPKQMSPEEAKRIMDAMKQEEKNERLQLRPVVRPIKVDKDW